MGLYRHEPMIHLEGPFPLSPAQEGFAAEMRKLFAADDGKVNDPHAVLKVQPEWKDDPLHFHVYSLDYVALEALRNDELSNDIRPLVLSANVLLICRENREIILHRRAPDSRTYPCALHTIGGAYWPPDVDGREGDRLSLRRTAAREAGEESDVFLRKALLPMSTMTIYPIALGRRVVGSQQENWLFSLG